MKSADPETGALMDDTQIRDEAMSWAGHVNKTGLTALLVEGDDGTHLEKQEIAAALRHHETEHGQARPSA